MIVEPDVGINAVGRLAIGVDIKVELVVEYDVVVMEFVDFEGEVAAAE